MRTNFNINSWAKNRGKDHSKIIPKIHFIKTFNSNTTYKITKFQLKVTDKNNKN